MPLHWARKLKRGYNQAEALARGLAAETGWQMDTHVLRRLRRTRSNARLAHEQRAANVASAFGATHAVPGGRFLLIDDVLTTGSTAEQCARALRQAGAEWVGIMTYARAAQSFAAAPHRLMTPIPTQAQITRLLAVLAKFDGLPRDLISRISPAAHSFGELPARRFCVLV